MLVPTDEEQHLLDILTNEWWSANVKTRDLLDVSITGAELTQAGVVASLKLSENIPREKLMGAVDRLRVVLQVEDDHPLVILPGGRASLAKLAVRTRRVTDEMDMLWHPGCKGLGVDTVTGEVVELPRLSQIQVAGAKGSGKSWSFRPMMASLVLDPQFEMLFMDPKVVEGTRWKGLTPTFFPGEFEDALDEVVTDLWRRRDLMQKEGATVWRPEFGPYRIVSVDEGREFLSELRIADKRRAQRSRPRDPEEVLELEDGEGALHNLIRISSMGRAWGVFLWWATQYPIVSTSNPGIDTNVDMNADYRFSLRVGKRKHAEVSLGDDADYGPHLISADDRNRGFGYLGGHGPNLIQTWTVTDEMLSLLAYPDHGRGRFPRDIALKALKSQPEAFWTPDLLASRTGCGRDQANRFLRSFSREGLMTVDRDVFRLAV